MGSNTTMKKRLHMLCDAGTVMALSLAIDIIKEERVFYGKIKEVCEDHIIFEEIPGLHPAKRYKINKRLIMPFINNEIILIAPIEGYK